MRLRNRVLHYQFENKKEIRIPDIFEKVWLFSGCGSHNVITGLQYKELTQKLVHQKTLILTPAIQFTILLVFCF